MGSWADSGGMTDLLDGFRGSTLPVFVVVGLGVLILLAAVRGDRRSKRWWVDSPVVEGVIVERRAQANREGTFRVLVRFVPQAGGEVSGWSRNVIDIASSPKPGTSVRVAYDVSEPSVFEVKPLVDPEPVGVWWWVLVAGIVGFVGLILWVTWF